MRRSIVDFLAFVSAQVFFGGGAILFVFFPEAMTGSWRASDLSRICVWVMIGDIIPCSAGVIWLICRAVGKSQWYPKKLLSYIKPGAIIIPLIFAAASPSKEFLVTGLLICFSMFLTALYGIVLLRGTAPPPK